MAGWSARLYPVEERVPVTVQLYLDDPLRVAARRALAPELGARARVVMGLATGERLLKGLAVGVGQRKHVARRRILGDDGDETVLIVLHSVRRFSHSSISSLADTWFTSRTGMPACIMCSLTSAMLYSPKWKMLAARTAPAPAFTAAIICSGLPAPPDATMGRVVFSATAEIRSRSYPVSVPSASMLLSTNSPAPRLSPSTSHPTASIPVLTRPPFR